MKDQEEREKEIIIEYFLLLLFRIFILSIEYEPSIIYMQIIVLFLQAIIYFIRIIKELKASREV